MDAALAHMCVHRGSCEELACKKGKSLETVREASRIRLRGPLQPLAVGRHSSACPRDRNSATTRSETRWGKHDSRWLLVLAALSISLIAPASPGTPPSSPPLCPQTTSSCLTSHRIPDSKSSRQHSQHGGNHHKSARVSGICVPYLLGHSPTFIPEHLIWMPES